MNLSLAALRQAVRTQVAGVAGGAAGTGFAVNTIHVVIASGIGQASMLAASLIVANMLGVADFARYSIIATTLMTAATLSQAALGLTLSREVSQSHGRDPVRTAQAITFAFGIASLLSTTVAVVALLGGAPLAALLFGDIAYADGLAIAAVALPFAALSLVQAQLFVGLGETRRQLRTAVWATAITLVAPAAGGFLGGWRGALAGFALVHVARVLIGQLILHPAISREGIHVPAAGSRMLAREMLGFALPMLVAGAATLVALWWSNTFLLRRAGEVETGLFASAYMIRTILTFVPLQAATVLFAFLVRRDAAGGDRPTAGVLRGSFMMTLVGGVVAGLCASAPETVLSLFGSGFERGAGVLRIMLLVAVIEIALAWMYQLALADGRVWRAFFGVTLPRELTMVATALVLVPRLGGEGLAWAMAAGQGAALIGATLLAQPWRSTR